MPDTEARVMAFDFGLRHIGVAIAQPVTRQARGIATLKARAGKPKWYEVRALVKEFGPQVLVVGLPLNMDGTESAMTANARQFARDLNNKLGLPAFLQDERLTSHAAAQGLDTAHALGDADSDHELAAVLIAESYLREARSG